MLTSQEKKSRLESMLARVQQNRPGGKAEAPQMVVETLSEELPAPESPISIESSLNYDDNREPTDVVATEFVPAPLMEAATPSPAFEESDDEIDFGIEAPDDISSAPSLSPEPIAVPLDAPAVPEDSFASVVPGSVAPAAPAPAPAAPAPAAPASTAPSQSFSATPSASSSVVTMDGELTEGWTIEAVLNRAWRLGAN